MMAFMLLLVAQTAVRRYVPTAMVSATTISIAPTAKVIRIPVAPASGRAVVMSMDADASANTAPITDAPVMSPRLRERLSMPAMTTRWAGRGTDMTAGVLTAWNSARLAA